MAWVWFLLTLTLLSTLAQPPERREEAVPNNNRCIVLLLRRLGLANRLGSLADWYLVARTTNRKLIVSWTPSPDLNASFDKLFDVARLPSNLQVLPYVLDTEEMVAQYAKENNLTYGVVQHSGDWWGGSALDPSKETFFINASKVLDTSVQVLVSTWDGYLSLSSQSCQYYLTKRSKFLQSLHPVEWIQTFLANFVDEHLRNRLVVGVHVRVDDPAFDWNVVPPLQRGDTSALGFSSASLSAFERTIADITSHFNSHGQEVTFLLASNSDSVKTHLHSKFSNTISMSGNTARYSEDGMAFALLEWLALSQTDLVINTYGSTFAAEAAQVHQVPLVGVWGEHLIQHSDVRLAFCGHMQHVKALSVRGSFGVFEEGTHDRRRVDSRQALLLPCSLLEDWGIRGTFCTSRGET